MADFKFKSEIIDTTENLLEAFDFSYYDLEETISDYNLSFPSDGQEQADIEKASLPEFNIAFYELCTKYQRVPSQKEFYDYYLDKNKDKTVRVAGEVKKISDFTDEQKKALKARLYKRPYPSLVRDIHFGLMMRARTLFKVFSSIETDSDKGYDLLVREDMLEKDFAVHLWLMTSNSLSYRRRKKEYRHEFKEDYVNIETPIDPFQIAGNENQGKEVGDFFLYDEGQVLKLTKKIFELNQKIQ